MFNSRNKSSSSTRKRSYNNISKTPPGYSVFNKTRNQTRKRGKKVNKINNILNTRKSNSSRRSSSNRRSNSISNEFLKLRITNSTVRNRRNTSRRERKPKYEPANAVVAEAAEEVQEVPPVVSQIRPITPINNINHIRLRLDPNHKSGFKKVFSVIKNETNRQPTNILAETPSPELGEILVLSQQLVRPENKSKLNSELALQRRFSNLKPRRSPAISNYIRTSTSNTHPNSLYYYAEKMKTFKNISEEKRNNRDYVEHLYDSLLDCVEGIFLQTGYINIDMKEDNLVIDERISSERPNVLFIDTDPTFLLKIMNDNKLKLSSRHETRPEDIDYYSDSVKLAMLIMILFITSKNLQGSGLIRHPRVLSLGTLKSDPSNPINITKIDYVKSFCQKYNIQSFDDIYLRLKRINKSIQSLKPKFDLAYMIYYYCLHNHAEGNPEKYDKRNSKSYLLRIKRKFRDTFPTIFT